MITINEIHTFGTSHTKGGGFEWECNDTEKVNLLKKHYSHIDLPKKQEHFSWPGILSNKLNIKVFNHAESGFGDERMYRMFYHLIGDNEFYENIRNKLFIFEFAQMGRKEYFSNTINDYIIFNYWAKDILGEHFHDYKNFDEHNLDFTISNNYYKHDDRLNNPKLQNVFADFFKKSWAPHIYEKMVSQSAIQFIAFLETLSINYLIINSPFLTDYDMKTYIGWDIYEKEIQFEKRGANLLNFILYNKLTISDETNGGYSDGHAGFKANTLTAEYCKKHIEKYYTTIKKIF